MRAFMCAVALFAAVAGNAGAQSTQVDVDEVFRRGDLVTRAGDGIRAGEEEAVGAALALPRDDSDRWFVMVLSAQNPASQKLMADWKSSPHLLAFARPDDHQQSWAHYTEIKSEDQTQRWRVARYLTRSFPTIVIQPPRNGRYGDPGHVVFQQSGYEGDPQKLGTAMSAAIRAYVSKLANIQNSVGHSQAPGDQEVGGHPMPAWPSPDVALPSSPITIPPGPSAATLAELKAACPGADAEFLLTQLGEKATVESARQAWTIEQLRRDAQKARDEAKTPVVAPAATSVLSSLLPWLLGLLGVGGLGGVIAFGLILFRNFRKATGQQPILTDAQFDALVKSLQTPPAATNPPAPTPAKA